MQNHGLPTIASRGAGDDVGGAPSRNHGTDQAARGLEERTTESECSPPVRAGNPVNQCASGRLRFRPQNQRAVFLGGASRLRGQTLPKTRSGSWVASAEGALKRC